MISIDCTRVENEVARNMYEASELDWLVYNTPVDYVNLLLHGSLLKKRKMQALVKPRLDWHLHFTFLYYITLGAGVNSLESGYKRATPSWRREQRST